VCLPLIDLCSLGSETALRVNSQVEHNLRLELILRMGYLAGWSQVRLVRLIKPKVEKWCAG
jgi:hypothetical protein